MIKIKSVDANEAKAWLDNQEAIIVDVREPGEYQEMHIEGSTLILWVKISHASCHRLHDKKLIIHCKLGKRGSIACEKLLAENPALDVYNLEGGITAWQDAGYQVKK